MAGIAGTDPKTKKEGLTYLDRSATTITEVLFSNHYQTAGFFQNPFVEPGFGLNRGFELYDYFPGDNLHIRNAQQVADLAMNWLDKSLEKRRPFFMMVHFFDPHLAYDPPSDFGMPYIIGYKGSLKPPFNPSNDDLDKMQKGELTFSPEDQQFIMGLYNGELSFVDYNIGRFFDYLKLKNLYNNTLIIITGDHGEEFWDHKSFEHGHTLYNELLEVPLIIRFPDAENKGMVVKDRVSLTDLAPSIMTYVGIESAMHPNGGVL